MQKIYFFEAKNVIFSRLLSQGAKTKTQRAKFLCERAAIFQPFSAFQSHFTVFNTASKNMK